MRAAIIGLGVVGAAQVRMFKRKYGLVMYDPVHNESYPQALIDSCAFAVVSVGTPANTDGTCNLSYVYEALDELPARMPVILRSTVPVGTTEKLALGRSGHVVHVPEFMHENPEGAWKESYDVPFMMLGGSPYAREFFKPVLASVTDAAISEARADETELAKLVTNAYWAVKVSFVNHVERIARARNLDYEAVQALWTSHPQVEAAYTDMFGYGYGFGGRCLPKDLDDLSKHLPLPNLFQWVSEWNKGLPRS